MRTVRVAPLAMQHEEQNEPGADEDPPEDQPGEPGSAGGSQSPAADKLPAAPADDDSPLGDTDQHSDA
jgi:hypothetical protein